MPKYKIDYYFDGYGEAEIEAKSEKQAKKLFYEGEFERVNEWSEDTQMSNIEKVAQK